MRYIVFLIFLFSLQFHSYSQTAEVGLWAGGTNSFNDLNTRSSFKTSRPAGGLLAKYNFNNRFAGEIMASYGRTYSSDQELGFTSFHKARNEASRTTAFDASAKVEFNFFPFDITGDYLNENSLITPYLSAGLGVTNLDVGIYSRIADGYIAANSVLMEDSQKLNSIQFVIPVAVGAKVKLSDSFILAGEFGARLLFTDYYDNISTVYNQNSIDHSPGTIDEVGFQRGDASRNDEYNLFGLKLSYIIPSNDCPKFNRK